MKLPQTVVDLYDLDRFDEGSLARCGLIIDYPANFSLVRRRDWNQELSIPDRDSRLFIHQALFCSTSEDTLDLSRSRPLLFPYCLPDGEKFFRSTIPDLRKAVQNGINPSEYLRKGDNRTAHLLQKRILFRRGCREKGKNTSEKVKRGSQFYQRLEINIILPPFQRDKKRYTIYIRGFGE